MNIKDIIHSIYPVGEASLRKLEQLLDEIALPKGHTLMTAGKTERNFYFIKKGIVRAYSYKDGQPVTFWFGMEGDAVISVKSYVRGEPGYENIELMEDCELYRFNTRMLTALYQQDLDIANWARKFIEEEFIRTEQRLIAMQFQTAAVRYHELVQHHPDLLQRVKLGHIASYLGVSQVSLSRIRKTK